jgi:hypothetical protein
MPSLEVPSAASASRRPGPLPEGERLGSLQAETSSHSWAAFGPREVEKQCEMMRDDENSFPLMAGLF